jgi:hypothetical protein
VHSGCFHSVGQFSELRFGLLHEVIALEHVGNDIGLVAGQQKADVAVGEVIEAVTLNTHLRSSKPTTWP